MWQFFFIFLVIFSTQYQDIEFRMSQKHYHKAVFVWQDLSRYLYFCQSPGGISVCSHSHKLLSHHVISTIFPASVPCRDVSCQGRWCSSKPFEGSRDTQVQKHVLSLTSDESSNTSNVGYAGTPGTARDLPFALLLYYNRQIRICLL